MSNIISSQKRNEFLVGEVAEVVGDYFGLLKQYDEAREEYNQALNAYERVNESSPDFNDAHKQKEIVRKKRDELPETQELSNAYQQFLTLAPELGQIGVNLTQWFQDVFDSGWQTLESFLRSQEENLVFRFATANRYRSGEPGTIEKKVVLVKLIDFGGELKTPLALMGNVELERNQRRDILFQLYPIGKDPYLPPGVKLIVLDETGEIFLKAQARNADNWIQLQFRGEALESFSVKIALGDASITEYFVI